MPASTPRRPKVSIGAESGTAMRLVTAPITEASPKLEAIIGAVAIWAAKEPAKRFESSSGDFSTGRKIVRETNACRGLLRSRMPKTAATESWKPGL